MSEDKTVVWVLQYVFGFALLTAVVPAAVYTLPNWTDAHVWASELFTIGVGVSLIACGSSMRQRMIVEKQIEQLAKQIKAIQET